MTAVTTGSLIGIENLGKITTIPNGYNDFRGCFRSQKSLTYAKLPNTLTSIGNYAFNDCSALVTFICNATTPPTLASNVFNNTPIASKTGTIYVPDASVDAYKAATNWSQYADIIKPLSEYTE